ncbi:hypothetical protein TNCV_802201 [Trichonephila clavipes]|nr:hypothetical protein TNCV_802201 [Trichonephila clavipes]
MTSCNHMCFRLCNGSQQPFFQQDNARPYTARVSQECLRTVTSLLWPAQSQSSISGIIWDRVQHPMSLNELEARESRIGTLPWSSPDTPSMIVRTQLEAGLVAKHYPSPVRMIPTQLSQAPL